MTLFDQIRVGARVTVATRFAGQTFTGRAYLRGPHGWVLGAGAHGARVQIATPENVVRVRVSRQKKGLAESKPMAYLIGVGQTTKNGGGK